MELMQIYDFSIAIQECNSMFVEKGVDWDYIIWTN